MNETSKPTEPVLAPWSEYVDLLKAAAELEQLVWGPAKRSSGRHSISSSR